MERLTFICEKILRFFDWLCKWICAFMLAAMVLVITAQVVLRWFDIPLAWSVELAQILFVEVSFVGGYLGTRKGSQIVVDMAQNALPEKIGDITYRICAVVSAVYFGMIVYYCFSLWPKLIASKTPIMNMNNGIIYAGIILACVMIVVAYLEQVVVGKPKKKAKEADEE